MLKEYISPDCIEIRLLAAGIIAASESFELDDFEDKGDLFQ